MPRLEVRVKTEQVMEDLDLAVAMRSRPDADRRNCETLRNRLGNARRYELQNDSESARCFQRLRIAHHCNGCFGISGLHSRPSLRMRRLRCESQVPTDWNTGAHQTLDRLGDFGAAF